MINMILCQHCTCATVETAQLLFLPCKLFVQVTCNQLFLEILVQLYSVFINRTGNV